MNLLHIKKKALIKVSLLLIMIPNIYFVLNYSVYAQVINADVPAGTVTTDTVQARPRETWTNYGTINASVPKAMSAVPVPVPPPGPSTVINENLINSSSTDIMHADGGNSFALNIGNIVGTATGGLGINGMHAVNGALIANIGTITITDKIGMHANGTGSLALNLGTATALKQTMFSGAGGISRNYGQLFAIGDPMPPSGSQSTDTIGGGDRGMFADGTGSEIINEASGVISSAGVASDPTYDPSGWLHQNGMLVAGGAHAENYGLINNDGRSGMLSEGVGSVAENYGTIENSNWNSMQATDDGTVHNFGILHNDDRNGMALIRGSHGINEATGVVQNIGIIGVILTGGSDFINKGRVVNQGSNGVYSIGSTVTNEDGGIIENKGGIGIYAESASTITNSGTISNTGSRGVHAVGSTITNTATGIINNNGVQGIYAESTSTITNEDGGTIANKGDEGIYAKGSSTVTNSGNIQNTGVRGVHVVGSTITNTATGNIQNTGNQGIYAESISTVVNEGTIANTGNQGILSNNSRVINRAGAFIRNDGDEGIHAANVKNANSKVTNEGTIENTGNIGIFIDTTGVTPALENTGIIHNGGNEGIHAENNGSSGSQVWNKNGGQIINDSDIGVLTKGPITLINDGTIANTGDYGVKATPIGNAGGSITNNVGGTIANTGNYGLDLTRSGLNNHGFISNTGDIGVHGTNSRLNNESDGTINNTGDVGILNEGILNGSLGRATNDGKVENDGNIGIKSLDGAFSVNTATGTVNNGGDYGMIAESTGANTSVTKVENNNIVSNAGKYGMAADGAVAQANNLGTIENTDEYGMQALNGGEVTNEGTKTGGSFTTGLIKNTGDYGMGADGANSHAINKGDIQAPVINYGMSAINGGTATNGDSTGSDITSGLINNSNNYGMKAEGTNSIAENYGTVSNTGSVPGDQVDVVTGIIANVTTTEKFNGFGMAAYGADSHANNYGLVANDKEIGMHAKDGGTVTNEGTQANNGGVANTGKYGMVAEATNAIAENAGSINNTGDYGMFATDGAKVFNRKTGDTLGSGNTSTSDGIVANTGNYGMVAIVSASEATNEGKIQAPVVNYGMAALDGGTAINGDSAGGNVAAGVIENSNNYGMIARGNNSTLENYGTIQNKGSDAGDQVRITIDGTSKDFNGFGMVAEGNGTEATNFGLIQNEKDFGMYASPGGLITNGTTVSGVKGIVANKGNYGMVAQGTPSTAKTIAENTGTVNNEGEYGMVSDGENSEAVNKGEIGSNVKDFGMLASNGGLVTNGDSAGGNVAIGVINNDGNAGMRAHGTGSIAQNYGTVQNIKNRGMEAEGTGAQANNYGVIDNKTQFGMYAHDSGIVVNEGKTQAGGVFTSGIIQNKSDYGMYALNSGAIADNSGFVNNENNYGMEAYNGGQIFNRKAGDILSNGHTALFDGIVSNKSDYGMHAWRSSTAINDGKIENQGDYGMAANNLSTVTNNGIVSNTNDYGMSATNSSTAINNGEISNTNDFGMVADGPTSKASNDNGGVIKNGGDNGLYTDNEGQLENLAGALIENLGDYGVHIISDGLNALNFNNQGEVSNKKDYGIFLDGTLATTAYKLLATNSDKVNNTGNYGMVSKGANSSIKNADTATSGGKATITNSGDYGMYVFEGSSAVNEGEVKNTGNYGMVAQDANSNIQNKSSGTIHNDGSYGMYAINGAHAENISAMISNKGDYGMVAGGDASEAKNGGIILNQGDYGMVAERKGSQAINEGTILNNGENGMYATTNTLTTPPTAPNSNAPEVLTDGTGTAQAIVANIAKVSNHSDYGMVANGVDSSAINYNEVSNTDAGNPGTADYGMAALEGGEVINQASGALLPDGVTASTTTGTIRNDGNYGMIAQSTGTDVTKATNNGEVSNKGDYGIVADGASSEGLNLGNVTGDVINIGMGARNGGTATNGDANSSPVSMTSGIIENSNNYGMKAEGNNSKVENYGTVSNKGGDTSDQVSVTIDGTSKDFNGFGMTADGAGSQAINHGIVKNDHEFGMYANEGGAVTNEGTPAGGPFTAGLIQNTGDYGMVAKSTGTDVTKATNNGDVSNTGNYGMVADGASSIADNYAKVVNSANNGMLATGVGAQAINHTGATVSNGTVGNSSTGSIGMEAREGGTIINDAGATVSNTNSKGMVAETNSGIHTEAHNIGTVSNIGDYGVISTGTGSIANNYNIVSNTDAGNPGTADYGMAAFDGGEVINQASGVLLPDGTPSTTTGKISNDGDYGMMAQSTGTDVTKATNNGEVSNKGDYGIVADGASSEGLNQGNVTGDVINIGMGARNGGTATNGDANSSPVSMASGIIENSNNYGMIADGTGSIADNYGTVYNKGGNAGDQVDVVIGGTPTQFNGFGMAANGTGSQANNHGIVKNKNEFGMYAKDGGIVTNVGTPTGGAFTAGLIQNTGNYGMAADGATSQAINKGDIQGNDPAGNPAYVENYGMAALNGGTATNGDSASRDVTSGLINNSNNYGMIADGTGSIADNYGTIHNTGSDTGDQVSVTINGASGDFNGFGMAANGKDSHANNYGIVKNENEFGMYAKDEGTVINEGTQVGGVFTTGLVSNTSDYGMVADGNGATAENAGLINNAGDYGMEATDGGQVFNRKAGSTLGNGNTSAFDGIVANDGDYGMVADGTASKASNEGIIRNNGENGLYTENEGELENLAGASIENLGDYGVHIISDGLATLSFDNQGGVSNKGDYGIYLNGTKATTANNLLAKNSGEVNNTGNYGMVSRGANSKIENALGGTITTGDLATDPDSAKYGMYVVDGSEALNNGLINNDNDYGMVAQGTDATVTNGATGQITTGVNNPNGAKYGMYAINGATAENQAGGEVSNNGDYGMVVAGDKSTGENGGIISNDGNYGMIATINSNVDTPTAPNTNVPTTIIAGTGAIVTIHNTGSVSNKGEFGMVADGVGTKATNEGLVNNDGDNGLYTDNGGTIENLLAGTIVNKGEFGAHLIGNNSSFTNYGIVANTDNYGIFLEGTNDTAINNGIVSNEQDYAMYALSTNNITNNNIIGNLGNYGMVAEGLSSIALNQGIIGSNNSPSDYGMYAFNGGQITNQKQTPATGTDGIIQNNGNYGMSAVGEASVATNNALVQNSGDYGMYASTIDTISNPIAPHSATANPIVSGSNGAQIINNDKISNTGIYGMQAEGDKATAENNGEVSNNNNIGMAAITNALATNKGIVNNSGDIGMQSTDGGTTINEAQTRGGAFVDGIIANTGKYGMEANGANSASLNKGEIRNTEQYGMFASNGGTITNFGGTEQGIVKNTDDYGMYADGTGSSAYNMGEVSNVGEYGIVSKGTGSQASNYNIVSNTDAGNPSTADYGMAALEGGEVINQASGALLPDGVTASTTLGKISNDGDYGMIAQSTGTDITKATNNGEVSNTGDYGIVADGASSEGLNLGNVTGAVKNIGMGARNEGTATNGDANSSPVSMASGIIENFNNYGMKAEGNNSKVENYGTVSNKGGDTSDQVSVTIGGTPTQFNGFGMAADGAGSQAINHSTVSNDKEFGMYASAGGVVTNEGTPAGGPFTAGFIKNNGNYGMAADGANSQAINKGDIQAPVVNYGMAALNGGSATNGDSASGDVTSGLINNTNNYGMIADGTGSIADNYGTVYNKGSVNGDQVDVVIGGTPTQFNGFGMAANGTGSQANNHGIVKNDHEFGMYAKDGGVVTNIGTPAGGAFTAGLIQNTGDYGMAADGTDSQAINKGDIQGNDPAGNPAYVENYGMAALNGGTATNGDSASGDVTSGLINNSNNYGMIADGTGSIADNYGTVYNKGGNAGDQVDVVIGGTPTQFNGFGMAANGTGSQANNHGIVKNDHEFGMYAKDGGIVTNIGTPTGGAFTAGLIQNTGDYGMAADGATSQAINKGDIQAPVVNYGMAALNGGTATNGDSASGDVTSGLINNTNNYGMIADGTGSIADNYGTIHNTGSDIGDQVDVVIGGTATPFNGFGMAANGTGSQANNQGVIENDHEFGMYASAGGTVTNKGAQAGGAFTAGLVANDGDYGMVADGTTSKASNEGIIRNNGENGLYTENEGELENLAGASIENLGDYGVHIISDGLATLSFDNQGGVSNKGDYGIYLNGTKATTANNLLAKNSGEVDNTGNYGMVSRGANSKIENALGGTITTGDLATDPDSAKYGMYVVDGSEALNNGLINNDNDYGMVAQGTDATVTNGATGQITTGVNNPNGAKYGMYAINGATAENQAGGEVSNNGDYGMVVAGDKSTGENGGIISNDGNYGMIATINSNVDTPTAPNTNVPTTIIAGTGAIVTIHNTGSVSNKGEFGMVADGVGTKATNEGLVNNDGDNGLYTDNGGTIENLLAGTIVNKGEFGAHLIGNNSSFTNYGIVANTDNYGIFLEGTNDTAINNGIVSNEQDYAMYALSTNNITNNNIIGNLGNYGMVAEGLSSIALNQGIIGSNNSPSDYGMYAFNGGQITNQKQTPATGTDGIIQNNGNYGMSAVGEASVATNNALVQNSGDYGMYASTIDTISNPIAPHSATANPIVSGSNGAQIINNDKISNTGMYGMQAEGDKATAENNGEVSNNNNIGMAAITNALATNKGIVNNSGDIGMQSTDGGTTINEAQTRGGAAFVDGIIANTGKYGMEANGANSASLNKGEIRNTEQYGMFASNGGTITNFGGTEQGIVKNTDDYGMYADGTGSSAYNMGEVSNVGEYGIVSKGTGSQASNYNIVSNTDAGNPSTADYGMAALEGGEVINQASGALLPDGVTASTTLGKISNDGDYGMIAQSTGTDITKATNNGEVSNTGDYGIVADGASSEGLNLGNVTGAVKNIGMGARNEGTATNGDANSSPVSMASGIIENFNNYGMKAEGNNSKVENYGTVSNKGGDTSDQVSVTIGGTPTQFNGFGMAADGAGSQAINHSTVSNDKEFGMYASAGGVVTNEGTPAGGPFTAGFIKNNGNYGMAADGANSQAINKGDIQAPVVNYGMAALNEGSATNGDSASGDVTSGLINNTNNYGMIADGTGSIADNYGTVYNKGSVNGDQVDVVIGGTPTQFNGFGMAANGTGSQANNHGIVKNDHEFGMYAKDGGVVTNIGTPAGGAFTAGLIQNTGDYGMAADGTDSQAINKGDIQGNDPAGNPAYVENYGMAALNGGTATNGDSASGDVTSGLINNSNNYGMIADGTGSIADNYGTVYNKGGNAGDQVDVVIGGTPTQFNGFGMAANGTGSQANNHGIVKNDHEFGMYAKDGGIVTNIGTPTGGAFTAGLIQNTGDYGMAADGTSSQAINKGDIQAPVVNYGMAALNGGTATNGDSASGDVTSGLINNSNNYGMIADGTGSIADNYGTIHNTGSDIGDQVDVVIGGTATPFNGFGMAANGTGSQANNQGVIENDHEFGMYASAGGTVTNKGAQAGGAFTAGLVANDGDYGMVADGTTSKASNEGIIRNNGENGLYTENEGELENLAGASIENLGDYGVHIISDGLATLSFDNQGGVSNKGDYGIYLNGTKATTANNLVAKNSGEVDNTGNYGMVSRGANSKIENALGGTITTGDLATDPDSAKYGMYVVDGSEALNNGLINNDNDYGMVAQGTDATVTNGATGQITTGANNPNGAKYGMYAINGATAENQAGGEVSNNGDYGMVVAGDKSTGENGGIISNDGNYGMIATINSNVDTPTAPNTNVPTTIIAGTGAIVTIHNTGSVSNKGEFGMVADGVGTKATNEGLVNNDGDNGLYTDNGGTIENLLAGTIVNKGEFGAHLIGNNSSFTNYGIVANTDNYGIFLEGTNDTAINNGIVSNEQDYAMYALSTNNITNNNIIGNLGNYGMVAEGLSSIALNQGIIGSNNSPSDYGMYAFNGGQITNQKQTPATGTDGIIQNNGNYGMSAVGEASVATNNALVQNSGDYGMYASTIDTISNPIAPHSATANPIVSGSNGAQIINNDKISNTGIYGMQAEGDKATAENNGEVSNNNNIGMAAITNALATNKGIVNNSGDIGMQSTDGGTTINEAQTRGGAAFVDGIIANTGKYGMEANGANSASLNKGEIRNTEQYGMFASNGGTITNFGGTEQGIVKNTDDYGMYADGTGSSATNDGIVANDGGYGISSVNGAISTNEQDGLVNNTGDYGMYAENKDSIANNNGIIRNIGNYGMMANGNGAIVNNMSTGKIEIGFDALGNPLANRDYGMAATNGSQANNYSSVHNNGQFGMIARDQDSEAINYGNVINNGENGMAAFAGAKVTNESVVANEGTRGMLATGTNSIATNKDTVSNQYEIGMIAEQGGRIINDTNGTVINNGEKGMVSADQNSSALNNGIVNNTGTIGMLAENGGTADNAGKIINAADIGMKASGTGSIVTNLANGIVMNGFDALSNVITPANYGMMAENGAKAINDTSAQVHNNGIRGMYATGSGSEVLNMGEVSNTDIEGMVADGTGALANNKGLVQNSGDIGMLALNGGHVINKGTTNGIVQNSGQKGMEARAVGSLATNSGLVNNDGDYGMYASDGGNIENTKDGRITNNGDYGMYNKEKNSVAINEGYIANVRDFGMYSDKLSTIINKGTIDSGGYEAMHVSNGGTAINQGTISVQTQNSATAKNTVFYAENNSIARNEGMIIIPNTTDSGVLTNNNNFYNNGMIVPKYDISMSGVNSITDKDYLAIQMDGGDSVLELGGGTYIRGITEGGAGEDTIILSGTTSRGDTVDVGTNSAHNFEKIVATNNVTNVKGNYYLNVSNLSPYQTTAFGTTTSHSIYSGKGNLGSLVLMGNINVGVDFDASDPTGYNDHTGKIIASTLDKKSPNAAITLTKGTPNSVDLIAQTLKVAPGDEFTINRIVILDQPVAVDPRFLSTDQYTGVQNHPNWQTFSYGSVQNGVFFINQKYYYKAPFDIITLPGSKHPYKTKQYIFIPRNRVDLDNINQLRYTTEMSIANKASTMGMGEYKFAAHNLSTLNNKYRANHNNNYAYTNDANGFVAEVLHKLTSKFTGGIGILYKHNNVNYDRLRVDKKYVKTKGRRHYEKLRSYDIRAFSLYQNKKFEVASGISLGQSDHSVISQFSSGQSEGKYKSNIITASSKFTYNFDFTRGIKISPNFGMEYVNLTETRLHFDNGLALHSDQNSSLISSIGVELSNKKLSNLNNKQNFYWNMELGYKHRSKRSTFHRGRSLEGYEDVIILSELFYSRDTFSATLGVDYNLGKDLGLYAKYQYEWNVDFQLHDLTLGLSYKF